MTYFADLTDYSYIPSGHASHAVTKNVGWLSAAHAFETGEPTEELLDRLWSYCNVSVAQTRGIHQCEFCSDKDVHFAERKSDKLLLGTSEIRVFAGFGYLYAASTLIYHFVKDHGYKPPEPFMQALMADPAPPAGEYFDRLTQASLHWQKTSVAEINPVPIYQPLMASQLAPQFTSDNETKCAPAVKSEIRLQDIALLIVGGFIVGAALGAICVAVARSFTNSKFVAGMIWGTVAYGSWLIGYVARARGWDSLRARFSSTRPKVLLAAAGCGIVLIVLLVAVVGLLRWLGIDVVPRPSPDFLPRNLSQLIFALILIGIIGPLAEERIFRGVLLDWLKLKNKRVGGGVYFERTICTSARQQFQAGSHRRNGIWRSNGTRSGLIGVRHSLSITSTLLHHARYLQWRHVRGQRIESRITNCAERNASDLPCIPASQWTTKLGITDHYAE